MKTSLPLAILFGAALIVAPSFAQETTPSPASAMSPSAAQPAPSGQPSAADMQKMMAQMMELAKLNENHKLLGSLAGTWTYDIKMWMNPEPNVPPQQSKGTDVSKPMMEGRYFIGEFDGRMQVLGSEVKMMYMNLK